ncbi:MAG: hypothetical protein FJ271_16295 [Planctomycetes bacterium]|nr:hypothetical protein [Planctomycetota bacterium]
MIRTFLASVVAFVAMALLTPAQAQQQASTFFTGVNPRDIKMKHIDVTAANRTPRMSNMMRPVRQPQTFTLSNMFRNLTLGSWPPKVAKTPILKESPYSKVIYPKKK